MFNARSQVHRYAFLPAMSTMLANMTMPLQTLFESDNNQFIYNYLLCIVFLNYVLSGGIRVADQGHFKTQHFSSEGLYRQPGAWPFRESQNSTALAFTKGRASRELKNAILETF